MKDLWKVLHLSFNTAQDRQIDFSVLDKISDKCPMECAPFSEAEFICTITRCNNSLTPGPDKLE